MRSISIEINDNNINICSRSNDSVSHEIHFTAYGIHKPSASAGVNQICQHSKG